MLSGGCPQKRAWKEEIVLFLTCLPSLSLLLLQPVLSPAPSGLQCKLKMNSCPGTLQDSSARLQLFRCQTPGTVQLLDSSAFHHEPDSVRLPRWTTACKPVYPTPFILSVLFLREPWLIQAFLLATVARMSQNFPASYTKVSPTPPRCLHP